MQLRGRQNRKAWSGWCGRALPFVSTPVAANTEVSVGGIGGITLVTAAFSCGREDKCGESKAHVYLSSAAEYISIEVTLECLFTRNISNKQLPCCLIFQLISSTEHFWSTVTVAPVPWVGKLWKYSMPHSENHVVALFVIWVTFR